MSNSLVVFVVVDYKKNLNESKKSSLYAPRSLKHLKISKYDYPSLTQDQINFNDCMNHTANHKLSCDQGDNIHKSLLTEGIDSSQKLNQVVREDFSSPEFVIKKNNHLKNIFKTAPYNVKYNTPRDYSDDLCSGCSVTELKNANYLL